MNVTVFGASGNVGKLVVKQLVADGHNVTVFVHKSNPFSDTPSVQIVQGDIISSSDIELALQGADAIISCLGSWHTPTKNILETAMKSIIPVAEKNPKLRLISLTGSAALAPGDSLTIVDKLNRYVLGKIAPKILYDGEAHIQLLSNSTLDWVVVRSPVMTSSKITHYNLDSHIPNPIATVSRNAVAYALVDLLKEKRYTRQALYIHS